MGIALSLTQLHALHGGASHRVRDLCHLSVDVLQSRAVSLPCENIFWYVTSRWGSPITSDPKIKQNDQSFETHPLVISFFSLSESASSSFACPNCWLISSARKLILKQLSICLDFCISNSISSAATTKQWKVSADHYFITLFGSVLPGPRDASHTFQNFWMLATHRCVKALSKENGVIQWLYSPCSRARKKIRILHFKALEDQYY